jgi:hypothetical protein
MLFCVTEVHSKEVIDEMIQTVRDIVFQGGVKE